MHGPVDMTRCGKWKSRVSLEAATELTGHCRVFRLIHESGNRAPLNNKTASTRRSHAASSRETPCASFWLASLSMLESFHAAASAK